MNERVSLLIREALEADLGAVLALIMWSVLSPVYDVLGKLKDDPEWLAGNAKLAGIPAIRSPAETEKFMKEQYELYEQLARHRVVLEASLLKPNLVLPGKDCPDGAAPGDIAAATVAALTSLPAKE
mgnify:CR=1 FL=1